LGAVEEADEAEDVEEEESESGWRPGGDLTALDPVEAEIENKVKDWREEAFHGSSPARAHRSHRWAPSVAEAEPAESVGSRAVAVTTLEPKPGEAPAFSGDAWAAAMAAGVEEKLAATQEILTSPAEPEKVSQVAPVVEAKEPASVATHTTEAQPQSKSDNGWYSVSASPWDLEAKKANRLASTWDAVVPDAPVVSNEPPAPEPVTHYVEQSHTEVAEPVQEYVHSALPEETPALLHEVTFENTNEATPETAAPSPYVGESHVDETQEIQSFQPPESKSWENTWVAAPPEVVNQFVETPSQEFVTEQRTPLVEAPQEVTSAPEPTIALEPAPAPNMDELVARVLSRMNPEILQKVTQDILKPVIEAIIKDELNCKKQ
jgi:hypothetical protein